jgi:hypothetical protein
MIMGRHKEGRASERIAEVRWAAIKKISTLDISMMTHSKSKITKILTSPKILTLTNNIILRKKIALLNPSQDKQM